MTIPEPISIGYFPKRTQPRPDWLKVDAVQQICSVSECISKGPDNWIQQWLHNELGFYDREEIAWQALGPDRTGFEMYAFKAYPLQFDLGQVKPWQVPVQLQLILTTFEFLGLDLVSRSSDAGFECSALSCNGAASDFSVNRFCLMEDLGAAYTACQKVSNGTYEPGPYHLVEVYRRNRTEK